MGDDDKTYEIYQQFSKEYGEECKSDNEQQIYNKFEEKEVGKNDQIVSRTKTDLDNGDNSDSDCDIKRSVIDITVVQSYKNNESIFVCNSSKKFGFSVFFKRPSHFQWSSDLCT